jgi:tetratricopeptide (TPR) repeat protein
VTDDDIDRPALEAERDFLLRSIDDLEVEREAGNIDDGTYRSLHDDYTARAAAVIRSLETGTDLTPPAPAGSSSLRRGLTIGGITAFAIIAAFFLAHAIGQRQPGQTITGNSQVKGSATTTTNPGQTLAALANANPENYAAQIAYARYLLGANDYTDALHEFGKSAQLDPSQPEPPTYAAWSAALLAEQVELKDPTESQPLFSASLQRLDEVIKDHPKYPDAYALKGVILFQFESNAKAAIPTFQQFLLLTNDNDPNRSEVLSLLAKAEAAVKASGGT